MSTFEESKIRRTQAGVSGGGQFATKTRSESGVSLAPSPKAWRADTVEEAFAEATRHGTGSGQRPRVMPKESLAALRADIKTLFGHKFSARMSSGTGYGWAHVSYDDGPRERAVQSVVDGYCNQRFNGMTDGYDSVNTSSPVEYTLSGVLVRRNIGEAGQAHIDAVFEAAGMTGYQRIDARTGERDTYSRYDWSAPLSAADLHGVERVLGQPVPPRFLERGELSAGELAGVVHQYTEFGKDGTAVTDLAAY